MPCSGAWCSSVCDPWVTRGAKRLLRGERDGTLFSASSSSRSANTVAGIIHTCPDTGLGSVPSVSESSARSNAHIT